MKAQKYGPLPLWGVALGAGLLGLLLRSLMFALGTDAGGVMIPGHWTYVCLWLLSAAAAGALALICKDMGTGEGMEGNLTASLSAALGTALGGILLSAGSLMELLQHRDTLNTAAGALGIAAGLCLVYLALLRKDGKANTPAFFVVTVFAAASLISRFRVWSTDPILGDYCFRLLASVSAMLAAFHLSGFPIGKGQRRRTLFFSALCVLFSLISLREGDLSQKLYFGGMALWLLLGSCSAEKPKKPRRVLGGGRELPETPKSEEENS